MDNIATLTRYKVDLRFNPVLNSYIENNFRRDGSVIGYPAYRSPNGALYVKERDQGLVS